MNSAPASPRRLNGDEDLNACLRIAKQIQHNLLPRTSPQIEGLDICGKCIYCDELGGDFFDYLNFKEVRCRSDHHIEIVVGDVSGQGSQEVA